MNVEQTVKTVSPQTSAERFAELLIAACNTNGEATADDSTNYVVLAKPPNGWKRGGKSIMRRFCDVVAKQDSLLEAGIVLEMLHGPIHQWREPESRLDGPPWWPKIRDAANENPLQTLALLIDSIDGMAL